MLTYNEYEQIVKRLESQLQKPVNADSERTFFAMSVIANLLDFTSIPKADKEVEYQEAKRKYILEFKNQMN